tara:strand:+ start:306 stop:638 length:333 start_codon:yes stop_codon:yes gene_type:complete
MSTTGLWDGFIEGEEPLLSFRLKDRQSGDLIDLTGATIGIKTWFRGDQSLIINGSCDLDPDPTTGQFSYQVSTGDFDRVGEHQVEVKITLSGGENRKLLFLVPIKAGAPA